MMGGRERVKRKKDLSRKVEKVGWRVSISLTERREKRGVFCGLSEIQRRIFGELERAVEGPGHLLDLLHEILESLGREKGSRLLLTRVVSS
jgi:hypothetical protein